MYSILIHSSNFKYFLTTNKSLYKGGKTGHVVSLYVIVSSKQKN